MIRLKKLNKKVIENTMNKVFKIISCSLLLIGMYTTQAQVLGKTSSGEEIRVDNRKKVEGIAAVIGDYVILESDLQKEILTNTMVENLTECVVLERMMEEKLYAHHAVQDSILVSDDEVNAEVEHTFDRFVKDAGSVERILSFYNLSSVAELKKTLHDVLKERKLSEKMQDKLTSELDITPEEVRKFFYDIPEKDRPVLGTELQIAQIVIKPEIDPEVEAEIKEKLNSIRRDVIDNGASFSSKAILYSDDSGTSGDGGFITVSRNDNSIVKEFKEVAFRLEEGEVSKPFKSMFGYHILMLEKVRGQDYDVRHILMVPRDTPRKIKEAREEIERIREKIILGKIDFHEAAKEFSDEENTAKNNGFLLNSMSGDYWFSQTNLDPKLYNRLEPLKEGEVSKIVEETDFLRKPLFKIFMVVKKKPEHVAQYNVDYMKIKEIALRDKKIKTIRNWQEERVGDTYIKINKNYRECDFFSNWLK